MVAMAAIGDENQTLAPKLGHQQDQIHCALIDARARGRTHPERPHPGCHQRVRVLWKVRVHSHAADTEQEGAAGGGLRGGLLQEGHLEARANCQ